MNKGGYAVFNDYIWQTYLSGTGEKTIDFFKFSLTTEFTNKYADKICELHKEFCPCGSVNKYFKFQLIQLAEDIENNDFWYGCYSIVDLPKNVTYSPDELMLKLYNGRRYDCLIFKNADKRR